MAEKTTPNLQGTKCLNCGSRMIIIHHQEFPYQIVGGRKTLATGVLGTETTICFKCEKAFVSEAALPPNFVKGLAAGYLRVYNLTGTKTLVISNQPLSYAQTT